MSNNLLPKGFEDLEKYAGWALPTEQERNNKRLSSGMEEITEIYDTLLSRIDEILTYLDKFELGKLPEKEQRLMYLAYALAEVANPVEIFKQPEVIDGFPAERFIPVHETIRTY